MAHGFILGIGRQHEIAIDGDRTGKLNESRLDVDLATHELLARMQFPRATQLHLKIDGRMVYLGRAVDAEGEVPDVLFRADLAPIPLWYPQFSAVLDWVNAAIVVVIWEPSGSARLSALLCRGIHRAQIGVAAWATAFLS